ncbi:MAG: metal-sulfur cluster assembly factor [Planctomycetota bacterium]
MTTDTIVPEIAPSPELALVAESPTNCSDDATSHAHTPHHAHGTGCCSTTPVSDATVATPADAMLEIAPTTGGSCCETPPAAADDASSETESTVDDGALIEALREVIDPELMINIVDLGLVYSINHTDRKAQVEMTLTSPACPAGPQIIMQSKMALEKVDGIDVAEIKLVMSPPWTPARMTDEARDQLGIF